MLLNADLRSTLLAVADLMSNTNDPWWIISSAAVALHGVPLDDVADVDVLISVGDAHRLQGSGDVSFQPGQADALFQSQLFGHWNGSVLAVEIMAGFCLKIARGWEPIEPHSRHPVTLDQQTLYVPDKAELLDMLRRFGRRKDLDRYRLLASR